MKRPTISDVASASGVSIGAVSRILNNDTSLNVRGETRAAVLHHSAALGYTPNPHARSLRTARTSTLAMILPEIESPAFAEMIQGAQRAARERGFAMLIGGIGPDGDDPALPSQLLERNRVDGFLMSSGLREVEALTALAKLEVPFVLLNRFNGPEQSYVAFDDEGGAQALTQHLIDLGHRKIAFLGTSERFLGIRRVAGYQSALERAGLTFDPGLVLDAGYSYEGGERAMLAALADPKPPTAVFATNHLVAAGAMVAAEAKGLRVPDDISIGSFYDGPVARLLRPSLTAVRFPLQELGYRAAAMLTDLIEGITAEPMGLVLPHEMVVARGSTSPLAAANT